MSKHDNPDHKNQQRVPVPQDPLLKVGLDPDEYEAVKGDPNIRRFLIAQRERSLAPQKVKDFERFVQGKKFAGLPEKAQVIARRRLEDAKTAGQSAFRASPPPQPARGQAVGGPLRSEMRSREPGASPYVLGEPFHNPYTFIPFPEQHDAPPRRSPTLLTVDELPGEKDSRTTGVLDLEIRTLSPLLSCAPGTENGGRDGAAVLNALAYGDDVVVPATGVRGSLRSLMTILIGGTLDYVDDQLWLLQGRDLPLGPGGVSGRREAFLARIVELPRPGGQAKLEIGETRLIDLASHETIRGEKLDAFRPKQGQRRRHCWVDEPKPSADGDPSPGANSPLSYVVSSIIEHKDETHNWQLKLSGRPVNRIGKREAAFKGSGQYLDVPPQVWQDFIDRSRHADIHVFEKNDLVWIEHREPSATTLTRPDEIESIQWARWGRKGQKLIDLLRKMHPHVLPDAWNPDGKVNPVTDLFGQVPMEDGAAEAFAARVRLENLIFAEGKQHLERGVQLAPLLQPHPGCVAFYRQSDDPQTVSVGDPLRGYKVYRNTRERGPGSPWLYQVQGVYGKDDSCAKSDEAASCKMSKKADLLQEGQTGRVRIAYRALTEDELGLLLLACTVDWRLGGGKPLGLGHCRVTRATIIDESGRQQTVFERSPAGYPEPATLPDPYASVEQRYRQRVRLWHASQQPVERLRYPRAVEENKNRTNRGGQVWFGRHAQPNKASAKGGADGGRQCKPGLQPLRAGGALRMKAGSGTIQAQILPVFDPDSPLADVLYGYDLCGERSGGGQNVLDSLEPFDPNKPNAGQSGRGAMGGNQSQNRTTREQEKRRRNQP